MEKRFSHKFSALGKHQEVILRDNQTKNRLGILSTYGAGLNRWEISSDTFTWNYIAGYEKEEDFIKKYNGVILAPFPNRLKNGAYSFSNHRYQLEVNQPQEGHSLHGFLYDKSFSIRSIDSDESKITLHLGYDYTGDNQAYPFQFMLDLLYIWDGEKLDIITEVENKGTSEMPFGLGWHPYFTFPVSVNELIWTMPSSYIYEVDENKIPTLEKSEFYEFIDGKLIDEDHYDDGFEFTSEKSTESLKLLDTKNQTEIEFNFALGDKNKADGGYRFLQVYTPLDRKRIAIEPMTCLADAFNNGKGLNILKPNTTLSNQWSISIKKPSR